jgi:hypothetical protein
MNRSVIRHLAIAALVAYPVSALGEGQAPDVTGKWIGKTHTILVGKGGHWPKGRGTWASPALLEKDLAFDIRGQDGRRALSREHLPARAERRRRARRSRRPAFRS